MHRWTQDKVPCRLFWPLTFRKVFDVKLFESGPCHYISLFLFLKKFSDGMEKGIKGGKRHFSQACPTFLILLQPKWFLWLWFDFRILSTSKKKLLRYDGTHFPLSQENVTKKHSLKSWKTPIMKSGMHILKLEWPDL